MDLENLSDASTDCGSEINEFEETAINRLIWGNITVKNNEGTLKCPFCVGKKKQDYRYADLLQHANGVSQGKRGEEAAGTHRALAKYLKENLASVAEPQKERTIHLEQETPERQSSEEQLVWPWMGIIMNIDNSKGENGKRVGPGNSEIKSRFSTFKPNSVHTFWNFHGHLGMAVIEFNNDMIGYGDAQDFERSFLEFGRGKRDWERKIASFDDLGKELYGWVASQQDYEAMDPVGKYLRERGNLRTVAQVNESESRKQDQLLQNLHTTIQEKNRELEDSRGQVFDLRTLVIQTENARRIAEAQKAGMEERHKQELRAVEQEANRIVQMRNDEMMRERQKIECDMKVLQQRCKELEKQEIHNDAERMNKEFEKDKNEKKMQRFLQIQELHKQQEAKKMMLIKKQEEECTGLFTKLHRQKKNLVSQHMLELEIQSLEAMIESKKLEDNGDFEGSKGIKKLEAELKDLTEEKEDLEEMNKQLTYKERELNDEIQSARKAAVKILEENGDDCTIGIKRMGELNHEPWKMVCKKKYKNDAEGWEVHFATLVSDWEKNIRDGSWYPFKTIHVGNDKFEKTINKADEKLSKLWEDLGEGVYETVVTALNELEEYNSSGRYPVPIAWNYKENKIATLEEILYYVATGKVTKKKRRT